jgi:transcription elongation factor GreA-like protein
VEIELIQCFVKVVQNGSITKAALSLGLPKSTVSKALSRLESQLGTKLIQHHRHTHDLLHEIQNIDLNKKFQHIIHNTSPTCPRTRRKSYQSHP